MMMMEVEAEEREYPQSSFRGDPNMTTAMARSIAHSAAAAIAEYCY
jgi:hypothetical protein